MSTPVYGYPDILRVAETVVKKSCNVKKGDNVLILAQTGSDKDIIDALMMASCIEGAEVSLAIYPTKPFNAEPPKPVAEAMRNADVIFDVVVNYIVFTNAFHKALETGARCLTMSASTRDLWLKPLSQIDLDKLYGLTKNIVKLFDATEIMKVTSVQGTNVTMKIKGRPSIACDGVATPGEYESFPSGYHMIVPIEGTINGTVILDGSIWPPIGIVKSPVKLLVEKDKIVSVEGEADAKRFENWLKSWNDPNMYYIAHFGVGTNSKAELTGIAFTDEKVCGTVNVGIGDNHLFPLKGKIKAVSHTDGIIMKPNLWLDDKLIIENGKYVHPSLIEFLE